LHFPFTSGLNLIGQGNLSLESKSVSGTIGTLKNTAKFWSKFCKLPLGVIFITFAGLTVSISKTVSSILFQSLVFILLLKIIEYSLSISNFFSGVNLIIFPLIKEIFHSIFGEILKFSKIIVFLSKSLEKVKSNSVAFTGIFLLLKSKYQAFVSEIPETKSLKIFFSEKFTLRNKSNSYYQK